MNLTHRRFTSTDAWQNERVWLPWEYSAGIAGSGFAAAVVLRNRNSAASAVIQESSVVAVLYTVWRLAGRLSVVHLEGAIGRGLWWWDLERLLFIPDEGVWQRVILPYPSLVKASNIYYGGAHVPAMGIFLVWLFFRHRDVYRSWRNAVAWVTLLSLVIQLLPVAPPRLIPALGIIDTGKLYGQSVYSSFDGNAGQLQAMPSIHVAWAVVIGLAVWQASSGRWRWVGWAHAAATAYVVVITGNHFWADGMVAVILLVLVRVTQRSLRERSAGRRRLTADVGQPISRAARVA